jgi:diacylglycerol kinase family enzyme
MKCHLVLNRASKGGSAGRKFGRIFRLLQDSGIEFDHTYAESYEDMKGASIRAHAGNYDAIVAVGGDGTINAVINGFFDEQGDLRSAKKMGVIYTGTSPDFCRSYGIPIEFEGAVNILKQGRTREIRLGRINLSGNLQETRYVTKYFSCCASIGIGAMVAQKANSARTYLGDIPGTFYAILYSLARFRQQEITVYLPGESKTYKRLTNVFVGRTKYIASGLRVNHEMDDHDDRFYLLCVHDLNLWRLPGLLRQLYSGETHPSVVMDVLYAGHIEIVSPLRALVEFDGDPAGYTPCSIQVSAAPLKLIVGGR